MKLDVIGILKCDGARLPIKGEFCAPPQEFIGNTFGFPSPIKVEGEIVNQSGRFFAEMAADAEVLSTCARCGEEVKETIHAEFSEVFTNADTDDDEMIPFSGTQIDITETVINNLLENLPEKFLCQSDCKGLCPYCGVNRNVKECSCTPDEGDIRMEIFRKLAKKEEV